ncbi:MAG: hypothetical protein ACPLRO_05410, partial [Candidatus Kapaibacteriota bacterium]
MANLGAYFGAGIGAAISVVGA